MAGVFMITKSTVVIYTEIAPRWIAYLGYVLASILLLGSKLTKVQFGVDRTRAVSVSAVQHD